MNAYAAATISATFYEGGKEIKTFHRLKPSTSYYLTVDEKGELKLKENTTMKPESKALGDNPKDILGSAKVPLSKLPPVSILHAAHAMMIGADKYGSWNWRAKKVIASIYIDAALRHLCAWADGEELASDSGVHHLGHVMACAAILLDAQETGNLIDDRPVTSEDSVFAKVLARLNDQIAARKK